MKNIQEKIQFMDQGFIARRGFFNDDEIRSLTEMTRHAQPGRRSHLDRNGLVFRQHLHFQSDGLRDFLSRPKVVDLLKEFCGPDFWIRKDQLVIKTPGGGVFPWHQDNGYNGILDAYYQLWIPLTRMTPENGGLWLIPGSHQNGILPHKIIDTHATWSGEDSSAVPILAEPGDIVLFSSLLLHRTGPNTTTLDRTAYVAEYMSCRHFDPYAQPPYFIVAEGGEPKPHFSQSYPGSRSLWNRIKLLPLHAQNTVGRLHGTLYRTVKRVVPSS